MISKYLIGIIIITFSTACAQKSTNDDSEFLTNLVKIVEENHVSPKALDDELSIQIFNSFLLKLDPDKIIFTSKEVNQLSSSEKLLDDEFNNGTTIFFDNAISQLSEGIARAESISNTYLNKEIDIIKEEYFETKVDNITFPKTKKALRTRTELFIKKHFLDELYIAEIAQPDLTLDDCKTIALQKTKLFFRDYFYHISSLSRKSLLEIYINQYLAINDYQSSYMSPKKKAEWDAKYHRNYVGVGLYIETTIDYPIIKQVIYNGPAYNTDKIKSGDLVLKISNKDDNLVDVAGFPLKKVIELLKGNNGSIVNIVVKKPTGETENISIQRGTLPMSKTISFILGADDNNQRIGYINLPRFYIGDKGSAIHFLEELEFLKKNSTDGIIIDLRNNKGGSSREAIDIMGYFLTGENVMQAKYRNRDSRIFEDPDKAVQYSGKLVVMVNENSGSASELFSSTMQDYNRALIVGSQTFGKGTMQWFYNISDTSNLGEVKLSIGSFYTGLGRSTQHKGVTPDIIFPSKNRYIKTGERKIKNALKFEDLDPLISLKQEDHLVKSLNNLVVLSQARQSKSTYFNALEQEALLIKHNENLSVINLNYEAYKMTKEKSRKVKIDNSDSVSFEIRDQLAYGNDKEEMAYWKSRLGKDQYLNESLLIMNDYLQLDL